MAPGCYSNNTKIKFRRCDLASHPCVLKGSSSALLACCYFHFMLFSQSLLCLQQGGTSEPAPAVPVTESWGVSMPLLSLSSGRTSNGCRNPSSSSFFIRLQPKPKTSDSFGLHLDSSWIKENPEFSKGKIMCLQCKFPLHKRDIQPCETQCISSKMSINSSKAQLPHLQAKN